MSSEVVVYLTSVDSLSGADRADMFKARIQETARSLATEALTEAAPNRLSILGAEGSAAVARIENETRQARILSRTSGTAD
jgi:hypothetical protein